MDPTHQPNADQATLWNGSAGRAWVEAQQALDRMFEPFERLLADGVIATPEARVLDVGCGTGATTLAIARRLRAPGGATGIDLSEPMLAVARARAEAEHAAATFVRADAQTHSFAPASVDRIVSRFGVMFFDDPIAAFANLLRAAAAGAPLDCIAWRGPDDNPFMTAERAAAPFLPDVPPRRADGPGQFGFADAARVRRILDAAGWRDVTIDPIDVTCTFAEASLVPYLTRLGPVGRALDGADERTRAQVIATVRAAMDPYVRGDEVRYTAACWRVGARA
jgi:SAM-dependent methyltransferase